MRACEQRLSGWAPLLGSVGLLAACLLLSGVAHATQLITAAEAELPPPKGAIPVDRRGILRAPKVELISPNGPDHSPFRLLLTFEPHGGTTINPDSVKIVYLRTPNVDLTPRVKPFVQAGGIDVPDAEVPPGEYAIKVDVKDTDGHPGTAIFTVTISP
jgi:hypothetical protein